MFTVGGDVPCSVHLQEEEPVKGLMAVEVKSAALPGKQMGKEHRPLKPLDQAKALSEGQSDSVQCVMKKKCQMWHPAGRV